MSTCVIEENNKGQIYAVIIWDSIIHLPSLLIFHLPLYSIAMHQHFYGVVLISRRDLTGNLRTVREYGLSIDRLASLYWKTPRLHTTPLRQKSLFHAAAVKALCLALPMCRDMGVTLALVVWIKSTSEKYSLDFKNCSFKIFSYYLNLRISITYSPSSKSGTYQEGIFPKPGIFPNLKLKWTNPNIIKKFRCIQ